MPDAPATPCQQPGCGEYAVRRGRCEEHAAKAELARGTTKERGYAGGWPWVRKQVLIRDGYECKIQLHCGRGAGREFGDTATEVDHILPIEERPDLRLVMSNLQAACKPCNAAKGGRYEGKGESSDETRKA